MDARSALIDLRHTVVRQLKLARSAFLRWPFWAKGGLLFGGALVLFNVLGASSYLSYRRQLEASQGIPRSKERLQLVVDALAQLRETRTQERRSLARPREGQKAYEAARGALLARVARLGLEAPVPGEDALDAVQTRLLELQGEESQRLQYLARRALWANRVFLASILIGNLLAFLVISLGGHSLLFHMSLGESSTRELARLKLFVDGSAEPIYGVGIDGRCVFCNRALLRLLGYQDAGELVGQPIHQWVFAPGSSPQESPALKAMLDALAEGRALHVQEGAAWRADGSFLSVECWSSPVHAEGRLTGATVTLQDVSAVHSNWERLEEANAALQDQVQELSRHSEEMSALSELTELLQASSSSQELCRVIAAFGHRLFPLEAGTLYLLPENGRPLEAVSSWGGYGEPGSGFDAQDCWSLRRAKPHYEEQGKEGLFCTHLPRPLPAFSLCLPLIAQGGTLGLLNLRAQAGQDGSSLSQSKQLLAVALAQQAALGLSNLRLREYLREDSIRDALTGLYNRRYLKEALEHEISRAARDGTSVGILAFDLDHFKEVNDGQGHAAGDRLLQALGGLVRESVRHADIACRYGGDEFVVILPGISRTQALDLAEALRTKTEKLMPELRTQDGSRCTLSIGVALYPENGRGPEALQLAADRALYRAKAAGRNKVTCATDSANG
jgi:diguanylate cyclase (GGDEF)-like protein/PAS domain S-box-containing protein